MQARIVELKQRRDRIKQELVINTNKLSRSLHTANNSPTQNFRYAKQPSCHGLNNRVSPNSFHKTSSNWKNINNPQPAVYS